MIYDEEGDKLVHIEFEQALRATCIDSMTYGDVNALLGGDAGAVDKVTAMISAIKVPTGKTITAPKPAPTAATGSAAPIVAYLVEAVQLGIKVPICITIVRPFIEHHMLSAVAAVSGRDTGATLYGPADMCVDAYSNSNPISSLYHCIRLT